MFGFRFDEDDQASKFLQKVTTHVRVKGERRSFRSYLWLTSIAALFLALTDSPRGGRAKKLEQFTLPPRRLSPAMVSPPAPGTFVHVAHVGINERGEVETSDDIEPGWTMMLEELQGFGPRRAGTMEKVDGLVACKENCPAGGEGKQQSKFGVV